MFSAWVTPGNESVVVLVPVVLESLHAEAVTQTTAIRVTVRRFENTGAPGSGLPIRLGRPKSHSINGCGSGHFAICREKQRNPCNYADSADDRPLGRPCHEAAGQDADALKEPDAADEQKQNSDNIRQDSHQDLDKFPADRRTRASKTVNEYTLRDIERHT